MKTFRSLVVLKRPKPELWLAMRDHMVDFAGNIADIESIRELARTTDANNVVHIVNEWRVRQQIPAMLRSVLKASELSWVDRNTWDATSDACTWAIEPNFLTEYIACSGTTSFASAMGGQGTRVIFTGEFDLKPGLLGKLSSMESLLSGFLESIVTTIIPRNLRAVVEAAAAFRLPQ
ncbi:MAG TPA: hypothetical protein VL614_21480 [Acetobacteraceae bacterium]|nr:hypothetical protein [Acetobacteraceae bacterium]